jgi:hypothetical protein
MRVARFGLPHALIWVLRNRLLGGSAPTDPTRGATHFHHHAASAAWARAMTATALIGPFLFLKP